MGKCEELFVEDEFASPEDMILSAEEFVEFADEREFPKDDGEMYLERKREDPSSRDAAFSLNYSSITLYEGKLPNAQLSLEGIFPRDDSQSVTWTSSDPSVASVDDTGYITAHKGGTAVITASLADGVSVTCKAKVNPVTYRALLIGNTYRNTWRFSWTINKKKFYRNALIGPSYDVKNMATVLKSLKTTKYKVTTANNLKASAFEKKILSAFKGADYNDVSLLYYSGHGGDGGTLIGNDGNSIGPYRLRSILDNVKGDKVLLIDACHSGALIGKGEEDFSSGFIGAFEEPSVPEDVDWDRNSLETEGLEPRSNAFQNYWYYVITACSGSQVSYDKYAPKSRKIIGTVYNLRSYDEMLYSGGYYELSNGVLTQYKSFYGAQGAFTRALLLGLGYYYTDPDNYAGLKKGSYMPAAGSDGFVTIPELYQYAKDNVSQHDVQCYSPFQLICKFFGR